MLSTGARGLTFIAKWVPATLYRNVSHNRGRVEPSGKLSWMGCCTHCPRCAISNSFHAFFCIFEFTRSCGEDGYSTFKRSYQHGDQSKINYNHVTKVSAIKHWRIPILGRDSSVGIATRYWLDGPGIESLWGRDFPHPSRSALGPTQPPTQWIPGLSQE